jgi:hypothetical protein
MPTSKITCQVSYELTPFSECYSTVSLATLKMIENAIASKVDGTLEAVFATHEQDRDCRSRFR